MIYLHKSISNGARMVTDWRGNMVITPIPVSAERHGNGHVAKLPHHHRQYKRTSLPASSEVA